MRVVYVREDMMGEGPLPDVDLERVIARLYIYQYTVIQRYQMASQALMVESQAGSACQART